MFRCGSRAARELLFLCARKEKVTKKKARPNSAKTPVSPSRLGPAQFHAAPAARNCRRHPWRRPFGRLPKRASCSGALLRGDNVNGKNPFGRAIRSEGLRWVLWLRLFGELNPRGARPNPTAFWEKPEGAPPWMAATFPRGRSRVGKRGSQKAVGFGGFRADRGAFLLVTFLCAG